MSTRGNIIFANYWTLDEHNITTENIISNPKHLAPQITKESYKVYVHSDMYPSRALKDLQEFLNLEGAKHRATDTSYLSAWFVGWKCLDMSKWTRRYNDRNFDVDKCKNPSLKNFKESRDFFGIGLLNELSDWASYTYMVIPKIKTENERYNYDEHSFDILIFDGGDFNYYLGKINSKDSLTNYENENWWY